MDNTINYHRAKIWQIAFFAFNNTATNLYIVFYCFLYHTMPLECWDWE